MSTTTVLQEGVQGALACTFLATILFGVTCTQAFYYFHRYTRDLSLVRITVALVCIFEAVHTALLVNDISHSFKLALSSADSTLSDYIYNGLGAAYLFGYFSIYVVNIFYAWRIWKISQRWLPGTAAALISTARLAAELSFCVFSITDPSTLPTDPKFVSAFTASLVLSGFADFCISLQMIYYLRQGRTSVRQTNSIIRRIIRYIVGTTALSGLLGLLITIMMKLEYPSFLWLALVPVQTKLYTNGMFVSLNSRTAPAKDNSSENDILSIRLEAAARGTDPAPKDTAENSEILTIEREPR